MCTASDPFKTEENRIRLSNSSYVFNSSIKGVHSVPPRPIKGGRNRSSPPHLELRAITLFKYKTKE